MGLKKTNEKKQAIEGLDRFLYDSGLNKEPGTFYLDAMDHPERYDGKTVRLVGQYFQEKSLPKGYGFFGRLAMTCCANDIAQIGWVCQYKRLYANGVYVSLTDKCQKMQSGDQMIIMFHEVDSEKAPKPKDEYITFS